MSATTTSATDAKCRLRADSLASSVAILLTVSVVQRTIGFGRGILFCRWLDPAELGEWEMAYSFLLLAAPLAVLGIPGSFGRYIEHYRQQGQLRMFLRRTTTWTAGLSLGTIFVVVVAAPHFSELIFGQPTKTTLVVLVAASLGAVILHHFLEALFTGLRMFRVVSMMHFAQSMGFAAISLSLLIGWKLGAAGIVIGYGAACLVSAAGALLWLVPALADLPSQAHAAPLPHRNFWPKLLRFAFWVWTANLLCNLFAVVDRYMIVHYGSISAGEALVQVGHYHSSRVVPLLLLSVADLLSSIVLPYLTQDWEAGRREQVHQRLNVVLKLASLGTFAACVCVLIGAPLLFDVAFRGKYDGGLAVLPLTLAYCAWSGTVVVAMTYLWCAERSVLTALPMAAGLVLNVLLNLVLLPRFGLTGAVLATTLANLACLASTYWLCHLAGMRFDLSTLLLSALPAALVAGTGVSLAVLAVTLIIATLTSSLFTSHEREEFRRLMSNTLHRLPVRTRDPQPTSH